ncbi:MAG: hypothetical protein ACYCTD_04875 [bacterium]
MKRKICIYGDVFRSNSAAQEIFKNSIYDAEQDEYYITFDFVEQKDYLVLQLCKNKISYRLSSELKPVWVGLIK